MSIFVCILPSRIHGKIEKVFPHTYVLSSVEGRDEEVWFQVGRRGSYYEVG